MTISHMLFEFKLILLTLLNWKAYLSCGTIKVYLVITKTLLTLHVIKTLKHSFRKFVLNISDY